MGTGNRLIADHWPNVAQDEFDCDVLAHFEPDFEADRMADAAARRVLGDESVYAQVWCSQCGGDFGPGDSGFSACTEHGGLACTF